MSGTLDTMRFRLDDADKGTPIGVEIEIGETGGATFHGDTPYTEWLYKNARQPPPGPPEDRIRVILGNPSYVRIVAVDAPATAG